MKPRIPAQSKALPLFRKGAQLLEFQPGQLGGAFAAA
jgi:hypothetical protein